jgi:hypothetical protein
MRWAKPWDSLAVWSHVLGPTLMMSGLWPLGLREQTDLAVTGGVTTYGVSWVGLEVLITFGSVVGLGPGCSNGAASWVQEKMVALGLAMEASPSGPV